jgi:hypothetical protein
MKSMLRRIILGTAVCALAGVMASATAQPKEGRMGEWKLNVEKSKFSPGPAPKSLTIVFEPAGKGVHLKADTVGPDGARTSTEYTANYDGKDYPLKGSQLADTVSLKRVDKNTVIRTDKKGGKKVTTLKSVLSKDGKTYTVDVAGVNAKGEPVKNHLVFERP